MNVVRIPGIHQFLAALNVMGWGGQGQTNMLTIIMNVVRIPGIHQFLAALNVVGWGARANQYAYHHNACC